MSNRQKIILDLCGGTGAWSKPYRKAGYTVHVISWPDHDVRETLVLNGRIHFISMKGTNPVAVDIKNIYGILAAPPCTMFSRARTTAKTPRDFEGAMAVVKACLEIIWIARSKGNLKFWALENPMGMLRQFLGNPANSFRGFEFGDDHVKFTDIWGYYKMPTGRFKKVPKFDRQKWASAKKPKEFSGLKLSRADVRAITPPKFAAAFYKLNK